MLFAEAVIAEVLGMLLISYTCIKHVRGSEGFALATGIWALVLFVAIPITKFALG